MEERVTNMEGAIKLLTDILDRQDKKMENQEEQIKSLDKILLRMESNQIVLNSRDNILEKSLDKLAKRVDEFMERTQNLFVHAGKELRNHDERIEKLEDKS